VVFFPLREAALLAFLSTSLMSVTPAWGEGMTILGTPMIVLCQDAANHSWEYWSGRLAEKAYDPQTFAWEISYDMRAFVKLYSLTGERIWLERAIAWSDHCADYSDVNGDGEPAWGNYNETWGRAGYPFVESVVIDGMVCQPIIELAQLIYGDDELRQDPAMRERADRYVKLVKAIVDRRHRYWTNVTEDSGYYWNDPDDGGEMVVINRFASLGIVEITLADVLNDSRYLDRPERMARFIKANLRYDERSDCYLWSYDVKKMSPEDITHGSIDVEFMVKAYLHGLCFDDVDMQRLVNTYQRKVWRGIEMFRGSKPFAVSIDGACCLDYFQYAKNWPFLSLVEPRVLEQHRVAIEVIAETRPGLHRDRVVAWTLSLMMDLGRALVAKGIKLDSLCAFTPEMVRPEIERLSEVVAAIDQIGGNSSRFTPVIQELYSTYEERVKENVSALLHSVWDAEEDARRARAEAYISAAEEAICRAGEIGIDTRRHELFLLGAKEAFERGNFDSACALCDYPLRLNALVEENRALLLVLTLGLLIVRWGAGDSHRRASVWERRSFPKVRRPPRTPPGGSKHP